MAPDGALVRSSSCVAFTVGTAVGVAVEMTGDVVVLTEGGLVTGIKVGVFVGAVVVGDCVARPSQTV